MKMQAIIAGRRVHGVGYRMFLLQRALEAGFQRFSARNRVLNGAEQVVVQYEGEPGQVDALGSIIREEHPRDADFSGVVFEPYEGYVVSITDYMHVIQIEQFSRGIPAIISIDRKQDQILLKMDRMGISVAGEIHDLRTDLRSYIDRRLSTMEQDIQQIEAKIGLI